MVFIYGGAYQGKLDYARERFNLEDGDIYAYAESGGAAERVPDQKCLCGVHLFVLSQLSAGRDPLAFLKINTGALRDKIIIADDISCGVVPMGAINREWREAAGRCATFLSQNAGEVWRVFCGIPTRIK